MNESSWTDVGLNIDETGSRLNVLLSVDYQSTPTNGSVNDSTMLSPSSRGLLDDGNASDAALVDGIPRSLFDPRMLAFRRVIHMLDLYGVPTVITVGIVGNIVCFFVFMATYLRRMSSCIYLAALSVTDALFLVTTLCAWLDNVNIDVYHRPGWCQVLTYVGFVTSFLDVWYVVGFTVERYLAICFPFKRQTLCSPKRAKIVVASLAVCGAVLFNFALWSSEVGYHYERPFCAPMPKYYTLVSGLSNVDTLITLIIPTVIIITSNIRITYAVAKFYRSRVRLEGPGRRAEHRNESCDYSPSAAGGPGTAPTSGPGGATDARSLYSNSSYNRLQMKVTKMLLIVSSVFLLCHIPSHSFRVYVFIMTFAVDGYQPSHMALLIQKLFQYIYYMNFSLNFFLYNISGRSFRKAMLRLGRVLCTRIAHCVRVQYAVLRYRRSSQLTRSPRCDVIPIRAPNQLYNCIHRVNAYNTCKVCEKYF